MKVPMMLACVSWEQHDDFAPKVVKESQKEAKTRISGPLSPFSEWSALPNFRKKIVGGLRVIRGWSKHWVDTIQGTTYVTMSEVIG